MEPIDKMLIECIEKMKRKEKLNLVEIIAIEFAVREFVKYRKLIIPQIYADEGQYTEAKH